MRVLWIVIATIVVVGLLVICAGQLGMLSGRQPNNLGVKDGKLKPPSRTENSVSSQADLHQGSDVLVDYARIDPIALQVDVAATMTKLEAVIAAMPGAKLIEKRDDYLYAQFTTRLLKFVDDVEFWVSPTDKVVHVRSASRVGRKDFGVNRARVEAIRAALTR
jgi:uncharacterized protein (DUF1499 family)